MDSRLVAKDPTTIFNLFGLIPWDPPGFLIIDMANINGLSTCASKVKSRTS